MENISQRRSGVLRKTIAVVLAIAFVASIISTITAFAAANLFKIQSAELSELSTTAEGDIASFDETEIASNVTFHELNDSAKYTITLKNTDSKDHIIESITDDNESPYISYEYDQHAGEQINAGADFVFVVTAKYSTAITNINQRAQANNVKFFIHFTDIEEEIPIVPNTGDNIYFSVIVLAISATGLIIIGIIALKKHKKASKFIAASIVAVAAIATTASVKAATTEVNDFAINANIELKSLLVATYEDGEGNSHEVVVNYNEAPAIPDQTKTGYTFVNWQDEAGNELDPTQPITDDTNYYPVFQANTYSIAFDKNGATSGEINSIECVYDQDCVLANNAFAKTGYDFANWNTSSYGTSDSYADGATVKNLAENGTVTLYAQWQARSDTHYTVEHYKMKLDGSYELAESEPLTGTTDSKVTPAVKEYTGFTQPSTQTGTIASDGSLVITYNYSRNRYALNATDATISASYPAEEGKYYFETPITLASAEKTGYHFEKWSDNSTDNPKQFTMPANDLDIAAVYTANSYQVKFEKNADDATGDMSNQSFNYDTAARLNKAAYTRDGYNFTGWNTKANGSGAHYDDEEEVNNLSAEDGAIIPLYAEWDKISAVITYHYGDFSFTGSNYLNTDLPLFSSDFFNKDTEEYRDFDINFTINSLTGNGGQNNNRNVLASCLDESNLHHFTGFDFRYHTNDKHFEIEANSNLTNNVVSPTTKNTVRQTPPDGGYPWDINIKRVGPQLYTNGGEVLDYSNIAGNFDVPLSFGAEKDVNDSIYRWAIADLSDITTAVTYKRGVELTLPEPTFTMHIFDGWNTKADGTGTNYTSLVPDEDLDLYAIWKDFKIDGYNVAYNYGDKAFNGVDEYLNTNISLFTNELYLNNFQINTSISNFEPRTDQDQSLNAILSSMNESKDPYPGFTYRYANTSGSAVGLQLIVNKNKRNEASRKNLSIESPVQIKREKRRLYLNDEMILDYEYFNKQFDSPLVFGAALNGSLSPFRYAKTSLDDIRVTVQYEKAKSLTLPRPAFNKSGCTFIGWTGDNGTTPELDVTIPAGNSTDKEYFANFSCGENTVTFHPNGGEVSERTRSITAGAAIGELPTPSRVGYDFNGWFIDLNDDSAVDASYIPTSDLTLRAKWTIKQYTITFDTDGGDAIAPITQDYDTVIVAPENPTKDGFDFVSWAPAIPEKMPAQNITVVAKWKESDANKYNIEFNYGDLSFNGSQYLNTNIAPFSTRDAKDDFEISFNIANNEFVTKQSSNLNSFVSAMDESGNPYPGFVFRRNGDNVYSLVANANASKTKTILYKNPVPTSFFIRRTDGILYDQDGQALFDMDDLARNFDTPISIGASLDKNNKPFRFSKSLLEDITIKLQRDDKEAYTLPEPIYTNDSCSFDGWIGSNGETPQKNVVIEAGNTEDKTYAPVFTCEP